MQEENLYEDSLLEKLQYTLTVKTNIHQALVDIGSTIEENAPFEDYPDEIRNIHSSLETNANKLLDVLYGDDSENRPEIENITDLEQFIDVLITAKENLAENLVLCGISASSSEPLGTLISKVSENA